MGFWIFLATLVWPQMTSVSVTWPQIIIFYDQKYDITKSGPYSPKMTKKCFNLIFKFLFQKFWFEVTERKRRSFEVTLRPPRIFRIPLLEWKRHWALHQQHSGWWTCISRQKSWSSCRYQQAWCWYKWANICVEINHKKTGECT